MNVLASALPLRGGRPGSSRPAAHRHAPRGPQPLPQTPDAGAAPLRVEVLAYAPTAFFHCLHCEFVFQQIDLGQKVHAEQDAGALPEDLQQEYAALSDWAYRLVQRHCGRVALHVVDVASLEGVWKALRYRVRRFPALIVNGRAHPIESDFITADAIVDQALAPS